MGQVKESVYSDYSQTMETNAKEKVWLVAATPSLVKI